MECLLCNKPVTYAGSEDLEKGICGGCIQVLLLATPVKIVKAYYLAIEKDQLEKAEILKTFVTEKEFIHEGDSYQQTINSTRTGEFKISREIRSSVDRAGFIKFSRAARIKVRKERRIR